MEPQPRPPPALPEEILIRFPPEDPASLVRAVLVCKPWRRLVSGDGFRRRFRQFHRTNPPPPCLVPSPQGPIDNGSPVALVGNTLYFRIDSKSILKYDLATQEISVILQPPGFLNKLITMEDGGLGVAKLDGATRLSLWSMETNTNGDIGWAQTMVIHLKKLLPANVSSIYCRCIGFALGVLLVGTDDGLFCFDLKSGREEVM